MTFEEQMQDEPFVRRMLAAWEWEMDEHLRGLAPASRAALPATRASEMVRLSDAELYMNLTKRCRHGRRS